MTVRHPFDRTDIDLTRLREALSTRLGRRVELLTSRPDFDGSDAKSNQADILYIDSKAPPTDSYTIMAHEFQHQLNFGAKVYRATAAGGQGALEALWLDEGQAHLAEDACGYGGENVTLLKQEVFTAFSDTALFEIQKDGLPMRGMAFTYVRYLFEQKGGVTYNADGGITDKGGGAMLQALHTSSKQGTGAISAVASPQFTDFKNVFDYCVVAISLDGRGTTTFPKYVFQPLVSDPLSAAQIHDARNLWGEETYFTEDEVLKTVNRKGAGALVIGPAGENLVGCAVIENDYWRSLGRTGVGAVMGSKKVKAVAFHGEKRRALANPGGVEQFAGETLERGKDSPAANAFRRLGTPMLVAMNNAVGGFPSKYWHLGTFEGWEKISAEGLLEQCNVSRAPVFDASWPPAISRRSGMGDTRG